MNNATAHAKLLKKLLAALSEKVDIPETPKRTPVENVIFGLLLAEADLGQADHAYERLMKHTVDLNDLRVSDVRDLAEFIGVRYPKGPQKAEAIKQVLNAIYMKSHAMELPKLDKLGKREGHVYLDKFPGMSSFASAYVCIFSTDAHAMPVDEMLYGKLKADGVIDPAATLEETQSFLEHHIHADEHIAAFYQLRAYAEGTAKASLKTARTSNVKRKKARK